MSTPAGIYVRQGGAWILLGVGTPPPPPVPTYPPNYGALGSYKPGAGTSGIPSGTALTVHPQLNGNLNLNTPGQVFDKVEFRNNPVVNVPGITFRRCRFRGQVGSPGGQAGLVRFMAGAVGGLVEDCEFNPQSPGWWWNGITGHQFTVRRSNFFNVVDGIEVYNNWVNGALTDVAVVIEANWIHDLSYFSPSPDGDNRTHNDCIQLEGGRNIRIVGNNLQCYLSNDPAVGSYPPVVARRSGNQGNAALMIKPDVQDIQQLYIVQNWLGGGDFTVNIAHRKGQTPERLLGDIGELSLNKFDRLPFAPGPFGGRWVSMPGSNNPPAVQCITNGNVFEDDNATLVPINRNG